RMSRTLQLRRYTINAARADEFVAGWASKIPALRAAAGFRVELAYLDRENGIFTWAVSAPGSRADFEAAQEAYYAAKAQAGLGNGNPDVLFKTEISFVEEAHPNFSEKR